MTREEFIKIPRHARVRYIGKDQTIIAQLTNAKKHDPMVQVAYYIYDYSSQSWAKERQLTLRTHTASFEKVVPEDWELVDSKRIDLTRSREKRKVNYADKKIKHELNSFATTFTNLQSIKTNINYHLDDLPVASKLKILTSLSEEQKLWFEALDLKPEELSAALKDAVSRLVTPEEPVAPELPLIEDKVNDTPASI